MGNLCSIFHSRFKHLVKVVNSTKKAQLVDYILLGWQNSTYKLKGSDQKWFMKHYNEIIAETGIPRSTLERYIKELDDEGFIVRRQALYSRSKGQDKFEVKKGTYIHITDKLIALLNPVQQPSPEALIDQENDIHNTVEDSHEETQPKQETPKTQCSDLDKNEGTDPLISRELYISDLYGLSFNNTITFKNFLNSVDKATAQSLIKQFNAIQQLLLTEVKEEIPEVVKKLILGTFFNLTFEHKKQFSLPQQVVAEYLYALINIDFYIPEVKDFKHRNNILAKLIRSNNWRTPKGFYNHFYLGQNFKDKQDLREGQWQQEKENEIKQNYKEEEHKDDRLIEIEQQLYEKNVLIERLNESIYRESSEEIILQIREKIQTTRKEIESLWDKQSLIEEEMDKHQDLPYFKLCA